MINFQHNETSDTGEDSDYEIDLEYEQSSEFEDLKERAYICNVHSLEQELEKLKSRKHPEFLRQVKKLEEEQKEYIKRADIFRKYQNDCLNRQLQREK
eukprot:Awhi_evm1s15537